MKILTIEVLQMEQHIETNVTYNQNMILRHLPPRFPVASLQPNSSLFVPLLQSLNFLSLYLVP